MPYDNDNRSQIALVSNKFAEIAGIKNGRDWTRGWLGMDSYLPSTDRLLNTKSGGDLQLYEEVAQDAQVKSCLQQRFRGLISHSWEVLPGGEKAIDKAAAEMVHQQLLNLRWDDIVEKMLWGTFYGYSVAEILWERQGDLVGIQDIRVRNRRRFHFDIDQQPRLKTFDSPFGEALPDRKFWHFRCGAADDDEPYGLGLAHWLYWLVFFKKVDLRWWVRYLELYAQPTRVGKYPAGSDDKAKKVLWQALSSFGVDDQIMIPEGMMVELLEAGRAGTADYDTLHGKLDEAIAKVILSQTMTTDNGSSMSQAQVHQDVSETIIEADADLIATSFNTSVIPWLMAYNYPGQEVATPRFNYKIENAPDLAAMIDRDAKIASLGFPPTAEYVASTYGDGFQRGAADNLTAQLPDGQINSLASLIGQALNSSWEVGLLESVMNISYPAIAPEQQAAFLAAYKKSLAGAAKNAAAEAAAAPPEDLNALFAKIPNGTKKQFKGQEYELINSRWHRVDNGDLLRNNHEKADHNQTEAEIQITRAEDQQARKELMESLAKEKPYVVKSLAGGGNEITKSGNTLDLGDMQITRSPQTIKVTPNDSGHQVDISAGSSIVLSGGTTTNFDSPADSYQITHLPIKIREASHQLQIHDFLYHRDRGILKKPNGKFAQFAAAPSHLALADQLASTSPFRPWFEALQTQLNQAATLAEFEATLDQAAQDLDEAEFAQLFAEAMTAASLGGYADA